MNEQLINKLFTITGAVYPLTRSELVRISWQTHLSNLS
jgi:hypothetical protein